jgi:hypothetical protein
MAQDMQLFNSLKDSGLLLQLVSRLTRPLLLHKHSEYSA